VWAWDNRIVIDDAGACGHAEPRTWRSEARHQREVAAGLGPRRHWKKVGVARALWIAWAIVVWNVVFDHVVVVSGRNVLRAAGTAVTTALNIDQFMRPAVTQALWLATIAAAAILFVGWSSVHLARSR
jgi:hypothetical protein